MYDPRLPPTDCCPHYFICAPSANCSTSAMTPLGLELSFYGRVNNTPYHLPDNGYFISPTTSSPLLPLSITSLYLTYCHYISDVHGVPHLLRHTCLPPSPTTFLFFHPHHTISLPPIFSSPPCVSSAALVTSFSIIPTRLLNIFLPHSSFPLCSPCSKLLALIYFSLSKVL